MSNECFAWPEILDLTNADTYSPIETKAKIPET